MKRIRKGADGRKAYEDWRGGLSLVDKIKTMEKVTFVQCERCKARFTTTETMKERRAFPCKSPGTDHVYAPYGTYLRLQSNFAGYQKGLQFPEGFRYAKQAIREFFGIDKREKYRTCRVRVIEANGRKKK